jgi:hypothetical protein
MFDVFQLILNIFPEYGAGLFFCNRNILLQFLQPEHLASVFATGTSCCSFSGVFKYVNKESD